MRAYGVRRRDWGLRCPCCLSKNEGHKPSARKRARQEWKKEFRRSMKCKSCKSKVEPDELDSQGICDWCCPDCWAYLEPDGWCGDCRKMVLPTYERDTK